MNKNVYLCTSFNDIQYILSHLVSSDLPCVVIVFNHRGIYDFFSNINYPNLELFFFKNRLINIRKLGFWLSEFKEIAKIWRFSTKYFDSDIYTISLYFDLQSLMLLNFLRKKNKIFVFRSTDLLSNFSACQNDFKTFFWSVLYFTRFQKYNTYQTITLGLSEFWINSYTLNFHVTKKPLLDKRINRFKIKAPTNRLYILLVFSLDEENRFGYLNLVNLINSLVTKFSDFDFVLKGHPRIGSPLAFDKFNFSEINSKLPLELIDLSNCKKVFGFGSVTLSNIACTDIHVYSLINLFPENLHNYKTDIIDYLKSQTDRVIFPPNLNQIN